ncbi:CBS domain-containing protein CBSX3, mitochondrial isoform X1 [Oryza sativa Japonica Group]|uniref:CBS domain-containing protein CBSX3, mitochondrial isoform X1 n=1 Tax=Oryza sativa subsp. japonica TaxID=39947 RepID=UPI000E1B56B7|nr:CBS domain-containing protein CBSX3, mitochondrial isoform X2 [Oryza sativa Japonica Group]
MDLHGIRGKVALNPVLKLPQGELVVFTDQFEPGIGRRTSAGLQHLLQELLSRLKMQGITKALRFHGKQLKLTVLQHMNKGIFSWATLISRIQTESPTVIIPHIGLENIRVREILNAKGEAKAGAVYWCCTSHFVHEAIKHMTAHNVGALVVLKSGDEKQLAGIVTERDFARKILLPGRPSEETRVGDIMTEEDKLITVSSNTNILQAMELMTERHIRHVPVFDEKVVGMITIGDVVKTIVDQQHQEVKQLKKYIRGDYY